MSNYELSLVKAGFKVERIGNGQNGEVFCRPLYEDVKIAIRVMEAVERSTNGGLRPRRRR